MDTNPTLEQAARAVISGNKSQAQVILAELLRREPKNEEAWLYLAELVEKKEYAIDCLERVLRINPSNKTAREKLLRLTKIDLPPTPPQTSPKELVAKTSSLAQPVETSPPKITATP